MPFDAHANLAISEVAFPPSPAVGGTTLGVLPGHGARFPAPPFNVTIWDRNLLPSPDSAEVARVTALVGDVFTLLRAQEGTTARNILPGDLMAETITAKALTDIESGVNFPQIQTGHVEAASLLVNADADVSGNLTVIGTVTAQDVNGQQGNFNDINVANLDADTLQATTSIMAPLGQFGSLGTTPLDPTHIIAPIPDAKLSVNVLTHTGGYPGGTTTFLRADGTFAAASGGGVAAHASTHYVGGSDAITGALSITTLTASADVVATNKVQADLVWAIGRLQIGSNNIVPTADGVLRLTNSGGTDFSLLQFGGTTNAFPALQRIGANLGVLTADASRYSNLFVGTLGLHNGTGQGYATAGVGTPEGAVALPVGSLFLRADGSTGTTLYVKETGAATTTGWRAMPVPGAPVAHASTHVVGGSDVIPNVAWTNAANTFTANQTVSGSVTVTGTILVANIFQNTVDGADTGLLVLSGGGGNTSARGALIGLSGNEHPVGLGRVTIATGNTPTANISFLTAADQVRGVMHPGGGFSWGSATDPGAGNLSVANELIVNGGHLFLGVDSAVCRNTVDGADTGAVFLSGGGAAAHNRGAIIGVYGNEAPGAGGQVIFSCGDVIGGRLQFMTGGLLRGAMYYSGGFSWGGDSDPGPGSFCVGIGGRDAGQPFADLNAYANGVLATGVPTAGGANHLLFFNPNGVVGYVQTNGLTTTFAEASDQRLKTDLGPVEVDVISRLDVRRFHWWDGTPGRGLYAQALYDLAPWAVVVGGDDPTTEPWGIDYSKLVPDLIVAVQHLQAELAALKAALGGA